MWTCPHCGREFKRTNQSHYCGKAPATVDEYILRQEESVQPMLVSLRNIINDAIPEAEEIIAWSMPTWKSKDYIIHFAVNKNYIGLYVWEEAVTHFSDRLNGYEANKGVIRLGFDRELPVGLIADIAEWSYKMIQNRENE